MPTASRVVRHPRAYVFAVRFNVWLLQVCITTSFLAQGSHLIAETRSSSNTASPVTQHQHRPVHLSNINVTRTAQPMHVTRPAALVVVEGESPGFGSPLPHHKSSSTSSLASGPGQPSRFLPYAQMQSPVGSPVSSGADASPTPYTPGYNAPLTRQASSSSTTSPALPVRPSHWTPASSPVAAHTAAASSNQISPASVHVAKDAPQTRYQFGATDAKGAAVSASAGAARIGGTHIAADRVKISHISAQKGGTTAGTAAGSYSATHQQKQTSLGSQSHTMQPSGSNSSIARNESFEKLDRLRNINRQLAATSALPQTRSQSDNSRKHSMELEPAIAMSPPRISIIAPR